MKRLLSIFFLFIYISVTAGVSVQLHYCHGYISAVTLGITEEDPCVCPDKPDRNCCADEFRYLKLDENHLSKSLINELNIQDTIVDLPIILNIFKENAIKSAPLSISTDPPSSPQDLSVLNCVFRI
jgi:hypothetical protein